MQNGDKGFFPTHFFFGSLLAPFLRLFFKLLYHQMSWSYDLVSAAVSVGRWKSWVKATLPYLSGERVLEIGHGPGHLQVALWEKGVRTFGLDESRQMGSQARLRLYNHGFDCLLISGYAQFLPFANQSFHQVVSTFPTDYIVQPRTLEEIYRVLVPGGALVVLPLAWITGKRPHEKLAAWLFRVTGESPSHNISVIRQKFTEPFRKAGFSTRLEVLQQDIGKLLLIHATRPE